MVIFFIVIVAFLVGLNNLYWYYAPSVRNQVELFAHGSQKTAAEESFGKYVKRKRHCSVRTLFTMYICIRVIKLSKSAFSFQFSLELTFRTVFWALFGMGDFNAVELGGHSDKMFTVRVGYVVYGAYNIAAVIVLLNMLIAMMSRSFDMIQASC